MTIVLGFLSGIALAALLVALYYARGIFVVYWVKFRGKRLVQPAGSRDAAGRLPWSSGIAIRLGKRQHILIVRNVR